MELGHVVLIVFGAMWERETWYPKFRMADLQNQY